MDSLPLRRVVEYTVNVNQLHKQVLCEISFLTRAT